MATPKKRSKYGQAVEDKLAERVDLVDAAGRAYEDLQRVKASAAAQVAKAEEAYSSAYAAAESAWSRKELDDIELPRPVLPRGTRKRSASTAASELQPKNSELSATEARTGAGVTIGS